MNVVTLDWNSIRPLNGGREKGFEELCAQLARAESPNGAQFERKGTPDAGVECYTVLRDETEWGWQAKYFHTLGNAQWSQLDKSVKTALVKHPRLSKYFICVPLDRPDARIEKQKSAKDKWDYYVGMWTKQAAKMGMTVEFHFWGSSELLERLARPEHIGRVRFWFDARGFDTAWFNARLNEAIRTAGPRYTPEIHIDLPIASKFEVFGRTDRFFECEKARARAIREELITLTHFQGAADDSVKGAVATVSAKVQKVLSSLGGIKVQPMGPLPFQAIMGQVSEAEQEAEDFSRLLNDLERDFEAETEPPKDQAFRSHRTNPFRDLLRRLLRVQSELRVARKSLSQGAAIANRAVMILRGDAGTGKTHLLCDIAQRRIADGRPTVLLMGQRFVSNDPPWSQALKQLDLVGMSAEEFVGALEAAAQAAGSRALLLIDAINEGAGRTIWPSHLEAFLTHLERSPWIGVVIAVRSSYEEILVPAGVRARAASVTHQGFIEHEYDATKTFFIYYGLEFPSTPLLAPEFQNPLFLKTLCHGLNAKGDRRLPRGYHGITAVFELYLDAVNQRLASSLGFDARIPLVQQALEAVVTTILDSGETWLTLPKAADIVNASLPGRDFERSLYRGLVVEGVLVEEAARHDSVKAWEVVFLAYERFADQLTVKTLLDKHIVRSDPATAFAQGGPLAFLCDETEYVAPGLLEALCIQIPERTGKELISLAPTCAERWGINDAFLQSLVWRAYEAFSDSTYDALNKLCQSELDLSDTIDVLLTVATLPGHPLNAHFLDRLLRKDTMPERDAWWSVNLHHMWGSRGSADRLVDWASSLEPSTEIDTETVDLCAIALSWLLTTSNRFLRDRATMGLVNLVTGRVTAMVRLVEQFADIDDLYVVERVYAAAYAVAMRSHDSAAVGALAKCVYDRVFAAGSPLPHILLRDYARGVIERAVHLDSGLEVNSDLVRPPYKSMWPEIPNDEEIKSLLPDRSEGSYDSGELEWGRRRIVNSVMEDDFARYIIGTNSSSTSSDWLALTLGEPMWKPPPRPEEQLRSLVGEFSADESKAWEAFETAAQAYAAATNEFDADWIERLGQNDTPGFLYGPDLEAFVLETEVERPPELAELEEKRDEAFAALEGILTQKNWQCLREIWDAKDSSLEARRPPQFDLHQIQRYILKRVFDMGWTEKRFGRFDRFHIGYQGRQASKPERIGKKYQWIAYHEIMAFVSDHFQYREWFHEEQGAQAFEGPWQGRLRDIDPSCSLKSLSGGTSLDGHAAAWWGPTKYGAWEHHSTALNWVLNCDNLPNVEELLIVTNPADDSRWVNGYGYFSWKQQPPADRKTTDVERRELWYICTGYLIRADDAKSFMKWAEGVDFWGRWMPDAPEVYQMYLGEHAWGPASRYFRQYYYGDDGWVRPDRECPVTLQNIAFEYLREADGFDCSIDEGYTLRLPSCDLINGLRIRWSGYNADFIDAENRIVAQDPTVHGEGPSSLLLQEAPLQKFLECEKLTICWAVLGEKRVLSPEIGSGSSHPRLRISGAYVLSRGRVNGFVKSMLDDPGQSKADSTSPKVINIARTAAQQETAD